MKSSSLELRFSLERLKRYLEQNPHKATELAINYFEDFSILAIEHKKMEQDFEVMQTELIQLRQQNSTVRKPPQLPSFLSPL